MKLSYHLYAQLFLIFRNIFSVSMARSTALPILLLPLFPFLALSSNNSTEFIFNGFNDTELDLYGASLVKPNGVIKLTNLSDNEIGRVFYPHPIRMFHNNSSNASRKVLSFSTSFVFAIVPPSSGKGGYGLAFTMAPSTSFPGAKAEHYFGLFNETSDNKPSNHVFLVEFDTVRGYDEESDGEANHVAFSTNGMKSIDQKIARHSINGTTKEDELRLDSGDPIQAWVEYDGERGWVNVSISPIKVEKPSEPLLSGAVNLSEIFLEDMYIGFSASTGVNKSFHYILGWTFRLNGRAPPLDWTQLPLVPNSPAEQKDSSSYKPQIIALIATLSALAVCLLGALVFFTVIRKRLHHEVLEDWELDCPHRFNYKDLHMATNGFKESELIGIGGFGAVYRGVLPTSGSEVAVKKIKPNSIQGMREFVAEVESLGRLRHKNLVNLQGWCKKKNELLLVYDYVPYGSLDSLLFKRRDGFVLRWEQRFHILKCIAAGLLYLHEEWERVVIHRDVKSSNVLIDANMNGKLSDFGLARSYEHGEISETTKVVGTIGYIAPELARNGKPSTGTDVFAYGVLIIEVGTGRRPVGSGDFILVDWVAECRQKGQMLDVVDPKLESVFDVEEMKLVLSLGLLCSHPQVEARPTMRQVVRYLNRDDPLPPVDDHWGSAYSQQIRYSNSRLSVALSSDTITSSGMSSFAGFSSSSFNIGTGR